MIWEDLKILFNETGTELYTYYTTLYWGENWARVPCICIKMYLEGYTKN